MAEGSRDARQVTKVKWDGEKMTAGYLRPREGAEPDEFTLVCGDEPVPEFKEALQALAGDVLDICELSGEDADAITVRGVTITWKHEVMGAVITALKALDTANAPLVLNTPHLPESPYSGQANDPNPLLPGGTVDRIQALATEALRYVDGVRAQQALPLEMS